MSLFIILLLLFWSEFFAEVPYREPLTFLSIPFDVLHITIYSLFTQNYFNSLLSEKISKIEEVEYKHEETKSDLKVLIEVVKQGFDDMNKRFEDINKRFDMMFKFMSLGFTMITILIVVFKFID